jgi:3-dehydroquinate synthase
MNNQIDVKLGDRSYPVHIGDGLIGQLPELMKSRGMNGRIMVITNQLVGRLHGARLAETLTAGGFLPELIVIPDGEAYKSLATAGKLYDSLARRHAERGTLIMAFGGGVIGDLTGFVAATYQRGVPFIQVPTTLLAQVDSSIGGKVAVNVGKLKNMAGTFYQPMLVVSDITLLNTLPATELQNGLAEIIKCGVIGDAELFGFLEQNMADLLQRNGDALAFAVSRAVGVKAGIVARDERDTGLRHNLNFGHTLGHAVECASDFGIKHGTAVALGMAAASRLANRLELLSGADLERITRLIAAAGLPVTVPVKRPEALLDAMRHDKKVAGGKLKFILPTGIENVIARDDIDPKLAIEALSG